MGKITEYDSIDKELAEGRAGEALNQKRMLTNDSTPNLPMFYRYVVLDTIFDPQIIDDVKLTYWEQTLGVINIKHAAIAPRNTIIAQRINSNTAATVENPMVLYPFFPPHLSFPCKAGEHVWVMFEDPYGTQRDLGYWFCRIVTGNHVEDVNYTHAHRLNDPSFFPGTKDSFNDNTQPKYEFRNGEVGKIDGERFTDAKTATVPGTDDGYKTLLKESDAGRLTHYEPVPRYRKRPGDMCVEGTNNSLIVLGRDRKGSVASYIDDPDNGKIPELPVSDVAVDGSALIDMVVGRGQTKDTGGNPVINDIQSKEIGKSKSELIENEGDPDYVNDRSRLLLLQKSQIDQIAGLQQFNKKFSEGAVQGTANKRVSITDDLLNSPNGDGGAMLKSDKIRLIARSDVEIVVVGYERDATDKKMIDVDDMDAYAAIVIKANGDVVFRPAKKGYIKLGDDTADRALLCTDAPAITKDGEVSPTTPALSTTMGGKFGGTGITTQGTWAKKILVTGAK